MFQVLNICAKYWQKAPVDHENYGMQRKWEQILIYPKVWQFIKQENRIQRMDGMKLVRKKFVVHFNIRQRKEEMQK